MFKSSVNLLKVGEMMEKRLQDKLCLTDRQSGVYIVGNRGKESGRNPGWISQHVKRRRTKKKIREEMQSLL